MGALEEKRLVTSLALTRQEIRELEVGVRDLGRRKVGVLELLRRRSHVEQSVSLHEEDSLDLRPERIRLEAIDSVLSREAATIVRSASAGGGLAVARESQSPPESHWWWWLDREVAERRRKKALKTGSIIAAVAVLILALNLILNTFSGSDPVEKRASSHADAAEQLLRNGEYDEAIAQYEKAVEALPTSSDSYVALGVLYELQDLTSKSEEALAVGRDLIGNDLDYLMRLAQTYQSAGQPDRGLVYADEATSLSPDSAQAYLIRGGIYEATGDKAKALADLERSATLAQAQGEEELYVLAKMRYGMLLQQVPSDALADDSTPPSSTE